MKQSLRDLWTTSPEYRRLYQPADEVKAVVAAARANAACCVRAFDALESATAAGLAISSAHCWPYPRQNLKPAESSSLSNMPQNADFN